MMDGTMGHHRSTGLTRAKRIESLILWLGLPLLLLVLSLTAGIVNYTPVRHDAAASSTQVMPVEPMPAPSAPPVPSIPMRPDRLLPVESSDDAGQSLHLDDPAAVS